MGTERRDSVGKLSSKGDSLPAGQLISAKALEGSDVFNCQGEDLGGIKEIVLDVRTGKVGYAVLSFGGFFGLGEKLFAVPWNALTLDLAHRRFVLDVQKDRLREAPGFNRHQGPDMSDDSWAQVFHHYYGTEQAQRELRL